MEAWPPSSENIDISIKEMIPIVIAAEIWGGSWGRRCIFFHTYNQAVFATLKSGLCHDRHLAFCLHELALHAILNSFTFLTVPTPGKVNKASDALSYFCFKEFKSLVPDANSASQHVPSLLLHKLLFLAWTVNRPN